MKTLVLAALALGTGTSWAAISYSQFAHPKGQYLLEYPSNWKRSFGLHTVWLKPPGRQGDEVKIGLELYPLGKDSPAEVSEFVKGLMEQVGPVKKLDSEESMKVAGHDAQRLAFTETARLKDDLGGDLPGPLQEIYYVVPLGKWFYVLKLQGLGASFRKALPEFERIARKLELKPPAEPEEKKSSSKKRR